jgi:hypothetical protein
MKIDPPEKVQPPPFLPEKAQSPAGVKAGPVRPPIDFSRLPSLLVVDRQDTKPQYESVVEALNENYYLYHIARVPGVPGVTTEYIPPVVFHLLAKTRPMIKGQRKGRASEKTIANCSCTLGIDIVSRFPEIEALANLIEEHAALGDLGTTQDQFTGTFLRDFRWQELGRSKKYSFETDEDTKKAMTKIVLDTWRKPRLLVCHSDGCSMGERALSIREP